MSGAIVKLDVGGTKYKTSLSTLTQVDRDSMLARMVQQNREANMIQNGEDIFIDRNGTLFEYVLEYLRNPIANIPWLPKDPETLHRLEAEADYYGVEGLKGLINQSLNRPKLIDYISAHLRDPRSQPPFLPDDKETLTRLMVEAHYHNMADLKEIVKLHEANPIWPGHRVQIKQEVIQALENVQQDRKGPRDHTVQIREFGQVKNPHRYCAGFSTHGFVDLQDVTGVIGKVIGKSESTCVVKFSFPLRDIQPIINGPNREKIVGNDFEWEIRKESLFQV